MSARDFSRDFGLDFAVHLEELMAPVLTMTSLAAMVHAAIPGLIECGTARDLGRATAETIRWPSAFVIPLAETAGPNRFMAGLVTDQRVDARFAVILAVRDIADRTGAAAMQTLEGIRPALLVALAQHRPAGAAGGCLHRSGRLISGIDREGSMFWQDDFTVTLDRRFAAPGGIWCRATSFACSGSSSRTAMASSSPTSPPRTRRCRPRSTRRCWCATCA